MTAEEYISMLSLQSHVEGGAFRETYRSQMLLPSSALSGPFAGDRYACTMIYFLLKHGDFSAFHKIASDEAWHFYDGDALTIYEIKPGGALTTHKLGKNLQNGESFQCVITAGNWFGSRCETPGGFSLGGCTVAPGFDFADFELAQRDVLANIYPEHTQLISELTR